MSVGMVAECAGYLGGALVVAAFWVPRDRTLNVLLCMGTALLAVEMHSLGALPAAAGYAVASTRSAALLRWPGSRAVLAASIVAGLAMSAATWSGLPSILLLVGGTLATLALALLAGTELRLLLAAASAVFCVHHALVGSVPALAMEVACLAGNLFQAVRGRRPGDSLQGGT